MNRAAPNFDFNRFFNTLDSKLEAPVKDHLKNVYSCLAICTFAAAVGGYVHMFTALLSGGLLTILLGVGALITLSVVPDNGKNRPMRLGLLAGFAFLSGINLGPILDMAMEINPALITKAFMASTLVFVCFTFSALFAEKRKFLYIGGTLMTLGSAFFVLSLTNLFFGSMFLFQMNLYLGLALMCGFILYDTHLIIEKRRLGDRDFIWHSVDLFIDFIGIFRRILILLMIKEKKNNNKNN